MRVPGQLLGQLSFQSHTTDRIPPIPLNNSILSIHLNNSILPIPLNNSILPIHLNNSILPLSFDIFNIASARHHLHNVTPSNSYNTLSILSVTSNSGVSYVLIINSFI